MNIRFGAQAELFTETEDNREGLLGKIKILNINQNLLKKYHGA